MDAAGGNQTRAAIDFAKEWRTDRILRRLEALMIVADVERVYILSGDGNIIEPDDGICAIGSGGPYAQAAAWKRPCASPRRSACTPSTG